jgi:hypothetical protein
VITGEAGGHFLSITTRSPTSSAALNLDAKFQAGAGTVGMTVQMTVAGSFTMSICRTADGL